jgi:hypothetical protein
MMTGPKLETQQITLYSALEKRLVELGLKTARAGEWLRIIRNLPKKGVSETEIEWTQIAWFLELDLEARITIDDIRKFLVCEQPCELLLQRHVEDKFAPVVRFDQQKLPAHPPPIKMRYGLRETRLLHVRDRSFGIGVWSHTQVDPELFGQNRYWSVSVPRGRKHLPTYDPVNRFASSSDALAYGRKLVGDMAASLRSKGFVGPVYAMNHFSEYILPDGSNYSEWLITAPHVPETYSGSHFEVDNVVAHVRTTDRISPEADRLLVMEEIQSDWNQSLREAEHVLAERGWIAGQRFPCDLDIPPFNPYLHHWLDAAVRMMILLAAENGYRGIAWLPGRLHAERFPSAIASGLEVFYDRIVLKAVEKLGRSWGKTVEQSQITTRTRRYRTSYCRTDKRWRVIETATQRVVEKFDDERNAEIYCASLETPVNEDVFVLMIDDGMRNDLKLNGLPRIGSVGPRAHLKDAIPGTHSEAAA